MDVLVLVVGSRSAGRENFPYGRKFISGSHWNTGFRPDSGPSQGTPGGRAIRPVLPFSEGSLSTRSTRSRSAFWTGEKGEKAVVGATGRKRHYRPPISAGAVALCRGSKRRSTRPAGCARRVFVGVAKFTASPNLVRHQAAPLPRAAHRSIPLRRSQSLRRRGKSRPSPRRRDPKAGKRSIPPPPTAPGSAQSACAEDAARSGPDRSRRGAPCP